MNGIDVKEALELIELTGSSVYGLFARANEVRLKNLGNKVRLCGVINAKSGHCTEDCKFCAQSVHNDTNVKCYSLVSPKEIVKAAGTSEKESATRFGIVTSGTAVDDKDEVASLQEAIDGISKQTKVKPCASLGNVSKETLLALKAAGLTRYHCNLETAESFFPEICTTKPWYDSVKTVKAAKEIGLGVCCGGLLGLGESRAQRVELLDSIRELDVDAVPLNFFNPVEGTPLSNIETIEPIECLKVIAVARLMMPTKEIRVCGGREANLRDLQSWALIAGADGLMVGGYLTTKGREVAEDLKMIKDAGFEVDWDGSH